MKNWYRFTRWLILYFSLQTIACLVLVCCYLSVENLRLALVYGIIACFNLSCTVTIIAIYFYNKSHQDNTP